MKNEKLKIKRFHYTLHITHYTNLRGSALIFALVALIFLAGIGLTFVFWLSSESRQTGRRQAVTKDYYVAEAGTEKTLFDIRDGDYQWSSTWTGYTSWYIIDGESVTVTVTNVGEQ